MILLAASAWAQNTPSGTPTTEETQSGTFRAPINVDGDTLHHLRGSSALPATERVVPVQNKIIEIVEASIAEQVSITLEDSEIGIRIFADGTRVSVVTDVDPDLDQMDLNVLRVLHGDATKQSIESYRTNRPEQVGVSGAIEAAAWTIGFALFIMVTNWLHRNGVAVFMKMMCRL